MRSRSFIVSLLYDEDYVVLVYSLGGSILRSELHLAVTTQLEVNEGICLIRRRGYAILS